MQPVGGKRLLLRGRRQEMETEQEEGAVLPAPTHTDGDCNKVRAS